MRDTRGVTVTVLVIGASGELGGRVARSLVGGGIAVRAMTRRAGAPMPEGVAEVVRADLRDPASLLDACAGVQRMFLVSSPSGDQIAFETNAIVAAERAGVEHVVKVSNLPIAGLDSGLHGNHRAIERRLADSPVPAAVLQPSFFASVLRRQIVVLRRGRFVLPPGDGRIAWNDPRDIADVAAAVLAASDPSIGPLRLTGPEALNAADLVARITAVTDRELELRQPPMAKWEAGLVASGMDAWLASSTVHLYQAVARGALADVSPDVERVLGRAPRRLDEWLRDELEPLLRE
jgi:uncharacterized protein YbjT (DUF2867 family)